MFLDESINVVNKSRPGSSTPLDSSSQPLSQWGNWDHVPAYTTPARFTDVVLHRPLDELAVNFFMSNYVGTDAMQSQFHYLPDFYLRNGSAYSHLQNAITAVGLAGYAKAMHQPDLIQSATKAYISALQELNTTLSTPETAGRESTLISVIFLSMFEVLVLPRAQGLENLTKHLNGATVVASLLIKRQRQTNFGRRLLRTLSQNVIMNCWIQNLALPADFLRLKSQMFGNLKEPPAPHSQFLDIVMELIGFRHAMQSGLYNSPTGIIAHSVSFDEDLKNFMKNIPQEGHFKTVRTDEDGELIFDGYYH
ncbi:hypothetical protein K469DRAFT_624800, partial [Zopfia rhizophila CBS 207.26]